MSTDNRTDQSIVLKDGRRLGFAEWGNPAGKPSLLFIGGSSRLAYPMVEMPDVRLITVDRPGLGLSTFQPNRRLLDLPDDIVELLDALNLQQVAVVGISQGGPSALACAYKIPQRLIAGSVVSSLAPPRFFELHPNLSSSVATFAKWAKNFPPAFRFQAELATWMVRLNPRWTFQQVLKTLPPNDRAVYEAQPELIPMFISDLIETYRQGSRGSAQEALLAYSLWGFRLEDIRAPVYVWHGENDSSVPVAMAHYLAQPYLTAKPPTLPTKGTFWD